MFCKSCQPTKVLFVYCDLHGSYKTVYLLVECAKLMCGENLTKEKWYKANSITNIIVYWLLDNFITVCLELEITFTLFF